MKKPIANKLLDEIKERFINKYCLCQNEQQKCDWCLIIKLETQVIAPMQEEINECKDHTAEYYHREDLHYKGGWYQTFEEQSDDVNECEIDDCKDIIKSKNQYYQPQSFNMRWKRGGFTY